MSDYFGRLPVWEKDHADFLRRLRSRRAPLKIVLKVKDDTFFLERWIEHHGAIVGPQNLVVFDNMSTLPGMGEIYERWDGALNLIRFGGFHNRLHRVGEFPELYSALQASADHFVFLDSDEYLVHIDADRRVHRGPVLLDLLARTRSGVLPGSWLENVQGCENRFWYDIRQDHVMTGLRSGKPIIASSVPVSGMINHNRQIDKSCYDRNVVANFFVLHLKRLSVRQRIATNLHKLQAYNAFKRPMTLDELLTLDPDDFAAGNKRNWIREIQTLSAMNDEDVRPCAPLPCAPLPRGQSEIGADDTLRFATPEQEEAFANLLSHPWEHVQRAL